MYTRCQTLLLFRDALGNPYPEGQRDCIFMLFRRSGNLVTVARMSHLLSALRVAILDPEDEDDSSPEESTTVVLVHGAFVDGSGWQEVYDLLSEQGFEVLVVQHSTSTLEGDVAATTNVIEAARFPVVLVGHSYGGMVISVAGNHGKVRSLAYVAAFAPDSGESAEKLASMPALAGESRAPLLPPRGGHCLVDPAKFPESFAADVTLSTARFMAASQVPWGIAAMQAEVSQPAWKSKPTSYLVANQDRMIPPSLQRMMARRSSARIAEIDSSHAVMLSHADDVAEFIIESMTLTTSDRGASQ